MAEKLNQSQPGHHMSRGSFLTSVGVKSNLKANRASVSYQLGTLGKYLNEVTDLLRGIRQQNDGEPSQKPIESEDGAFNPLKLAQMGNEFMKSVISSVQEQYLAAKEQMLKGEISDKKSRLGDSDSDSTETPTNETPTQDSSPVTDTGSENQTPEIPTTGSKNQIFGMPATGPENQVHGMPETRPENHFIFPLKELGKTGDEINANLQRGLEDAGGKVLDIEDNNFVSQFKGGSNSNGLSITQGVNGDCANATLLMAARSAGIMQGDAQTANSDLQTVRELVKPGSNQFQGTDLKDIIQGGKKLGFDTQKLNGSTDDVISELDKDNQPMVAVNPMEYGALKEKKGHMVLVKDYNPETDKFTLYDSLFPKPIEISRDKLQKAMKGAGKHSNTIVSLGKTKDNLVAQNTPKSSDPADPSDNQEYISKSVYSDGESSINKVMSK